MYAIIKTGGKQYTVKQGDVLDVEKLEGEAGDTVALEVLFLKGEEGIVAGAEAAAACVTASIVEQHKGDKVIVFKFKKRKGYKRLRGHRQQLTKIKIEAISASGAPAAAAPAVEAAPAPVEEAPAAAPAAELSSMTVAQLKELAAEKGIKLPSGARKAEIIEAIEQA